MRGLGDYRHRVQCDDEADCVSDYEPLGQVGRFGFSGWDVHVVYRHVWLRVVSIRAHYTRARRF